MVEEEKIIIYTEDRQPIGEINKKEYSKLKTVHFQGKDVEPWIECVTCFIVDPKDKTVAVQKRAKTEIDPGELDLCSGHVRAGEVPRLTTQRELQEEMKMDGFSKQDLLQKLQYCGELKADFSKHKPSNSMKCFASVFAILVDNKEQVNANEASVEDIHWIELRDVQNAIRTSMFRFPYTEDTKQVYEKIFDKINEIAFGEKQVHSQKEYTE